VRDHLSQLKSGIWRPHYSVKPNPLVGDKGFTVLGKPAEDRMRRL
jgi:hypothetical protein